MHTTATMGIEETPRAKVRISHLPDKGCQIQCGREHKSYAEPYQARAEDADYREAYRRILGGVSALMKGTWQPIRTDRVTPCCRAFNGTFASDGTETSISIFTERIARNVERTFAVQLAFRKTDGQCVEFYSKHPKECRLFDPFLASAATLFVPQNPAV